MKKGGLREGGGKKSGGAKWKFVGRKKLWPRMWEGNDAFINIFNFFDFVFGGNFITKRRRRIRRRRKKMILRRGWRRIIVGGGRKGGFKDFAELN